MNTALKNLIFEKVHRATKTGRVAEVKNEVEIAVRHQIINGRMGAREAQRVIGWTDSLKTIN